MTRAQTLVQFLNLRNEENWLTQRDNRLKSNSTATAAVAAVAAFRYAITSWRQNVKCHVIALKNIRSVMNTTTMIVLGYVMSSVTSGPLI